MIVDHVAKSPTLHFLISIVLTLANPYGLLALLGIPAVLAIHFLQRKAVELPVSTTSTSRAAGIGGATVGRSVVEKRKSPPNVAAATSMPEPPR